MLQSLSKPFLFYIAAQILPWVCQLQQFLQQLFCSENNESSTPEDYQYTPDYSELSSSYRPDRIVGGVPAKISEAPYLLSMQIFNRHFCTASIISPSWALTAAQCFPLYYSVKKISVYGGTNRVPNFGYEHKLAKVQINPDFDASGPIPVNDIAAFKTKTKFEYITNIMEPIPLPPSKIFNSGVLGTIFGWGALRENEYPLPTYLHKASVPVLTFIDCQKLVPQPHSTFCAGYFEGGTGPCHGDLGVPFIFENKIYGIFSSSTSGCGRAENPSVYAFVGDHLQWIKKLMNV